MWWNKPAPQPLAVGEAWHRELQLLLWHLQPINRTCLHRKGKCLHCLHCFPEFWQEERKGENRDTAVKSLPWLCHSPEQGREGVPALSHCPGPLCPAWHVAGWVALGLITMPGIVLPFPKQQLEIRPSAFSVTHFGEIVNTSLVGLFDQSNSGTRGRYLSPCIVRKKSYRKMQVYPLKSWLTM